MKKNEGITLVALVITIIILLILAGITISLTIGQRGILNRAQEAGKNYQKAAKREDEELTNFFNEVNKIEQLEGEKLATKVEEGDYVAYDATEGVIDTGKLEYTSLVGTGSLHGNGCATTSDGLDLSIGQKFTATNNIKWRVFNKNEETGEVVLISDEPIQTDTGTSFYMKGAVGYLYAEQELNEICKIYGYGKGANTEKIFEYETGDDIEGLEKGTIQESGARSINIDDIDSITNYDPTTFKYGNISYGDLFTHVIFYPTKTTATGKSNSAKKRSEKWTTYIYRASPYIEDTSSTIYDMLFGANDITYWMAHRSTDSASNYAAFRVSFVNNGFVHGDYLCDVGSSEFIEREFKFGIRPLVYLKSSIKTTGKDASGAWVISE